MSQRLSDIRGIYDKGGSLMVGIFCEDIQESNWENWAPNFMPT